MKIALFSDLHIEHYRAWEPSDFVSAQAIDQADVVVLAGDIDTAPAVGESAARLSRGKPCVVVGGNHEHYLHTIEDSSQLLAQGCARRSNVHYLENATTMIAGVRFIGATFWTDMMLHGSVERSSYIASNGLNDFRLIRMRENGPLFRPHHAIERHRTSREYIERAAAQPFSGPTVVVTHHAPAPESIHPRFDTDPLGPCFASDCRRLLESLKVDYWLHGHMHDARDYAIGSTRVLINPHGYRGEAGHNGYRRGFLLDTDSGEIQDV